MRICVKKEQKGRTVGAGKWQKIGKTLPINWS